jgi:hypothetical protein
MSKKVYILANPTARQNAIEAVKSAQDGFKVTVAEPTRSLDANALLHSLITELANQLQWAGKKRDVEIWKRLLVAAWCRTKGEPIEILPAIDGNGVDIVPARTSKLSKKDCSDLIEYIYAYGSENGIMWPSN